ncbi:MAG: precorrin-2 C(20)-methyltransferase [Chloroflexota bacterium]
MIGTLYGVGIGPGAPDLLTLRAAKVMRTVPVVCVPRRTSSATSYALSVVRDLLDPARQEIVELTFPMVRAAHPVREARDGAAARVGACLQSGRDVAFITEGDPLLYSTFIHLYRRLRAQRPPPPVEIVPGVTSITAAAAAAGLPLVDGAERLAILPATDDLRHVRAALEAFDTVVLLKVNSVFDHVLDLLEEMALVESAVHVTRAGAPTQRIEMDVRRLRGQPIDYLSLLVIKKMRESWA